MKAFYHLTIQITYFSHVYVHCLECPKCVGWEKNERQKMGPRKVNLSASMDPAK